MEPSLAIEIVMRHYWSQFCLEIVSVDIGFANDAMEVKSITYVSEE